MTCKDFTLGYVTEPLRLDQVNTPTDNNWKHQHLEPTLYKYFSGCDPVLAQTIDVELFQDTITIYHEKSPYLAKATKSSKPFFSLFRPSEASRLIYFLIYAVARWEKFFLSIHPSI